MTAKTHESDFWQLVERLEVQERHRGERSRALESHKYGDPARHVKFASEGRKQLDDLMGTKEAERMLRIDLENWIRWGRKRDWAPVGFKCPVGFLYKSSNVHENDYRPMPCNEFQAVKLERIIVALPEKHRQAFVMYQLGRAAVSGEVKILKGHDDAARLLGMAKTKYYEIVRQAHNMVLRQVLLSYKK